MAASDLTLEVLKRDLSVCKLDPSGFVFPEGELIFTAVTDEEVSLVCPTESVPADVTEREDGWHGFRIKGKLDFSLIGIIAEISKILAEADIGLFVISTFNTDYILVKDCNLSRALDILANEGYKIERS